MILPRTGVFICSCGNNISDRVDIGRLAEEASVMPGVVVAETYGLLCSPKGREYLAERIRANRLERLVVAACSPREHERTFMAVCAAAGLNPFMMEMANIREHVAWVTSDRDLATWKALRMIRAAVERAARHEALETSSIVCDPGVLVIGGGLTGMIASLILAEAGRRVVLLEREPELGGSPEGRDLAVTAELAEEVGRTSSIEVLTGSEPQEIVGFFGNFIVSVTSLDEPLRVGALVLATGCEMEDGKYRPSKGFSGIAGMLRLSAGQSGFPSRRHTFLDPFSTAIDGVYIAGCAGGPCGPGDSVRSAEAVAGGILSALVPGREVMTEPRRSVINETLCRGCRQCMDVCGFGAISFDEERFVCTVNGVLCKGCGNCAAACPSGAIRSLHFTPEQIRSQVEGALR
ncbi:MAG: hypothetical protein AVO35_06785 [Candidatus Aegiribacteria sp. MLS_C]|nr:MAG: hypothetical protein AVO35_06785 [Candidatus Aegiribacteria sp. MLS_C]